MSRRAKLIPGLLVCVFLGILYLRTLAPGLTWAFDGADGGDLISAAASGGVPHPTGYPTYLILESVFLRIPVGSPAFRTNLLSAILAVAAAAMIYSLALGASRSVIAGSVAGLAFGTAPLLWSQAIITEVYSLQALLTAGFLALLLRTHRTSLTELALGVVAGLTLGNHLMGILLVPLLALRDSVPRQGISGTPQKHARGLGDWLGVYGKRIMGLGVGLLVYAAIPLRASSHAAVNWEYADSLGAFLRLVSGSLYWTRLGHASGTYLIGASRSWAQLMLEQFTAAGLFVALFGLIILWRRQLLHIVLIWLVVSYSALSILYYSPDSYVYLLPALVAWSISIGLACQWLVERLAGMKPVAGPILGILVIVLIMLRAILGVPHMDLSRDRKAEDFARSVLISAPRDAILVTRGDEATFALWYHCYALRERPDIAIVASDLYVLPWYHRVLNDTYPGLALPAGPWISALTNANSFRPICTVTSILDPTLECSRQQARLDGEPQGY